MEDGWEGRSSDEDDFIKLTQHYVGGGLVHHDVPEIPIAVKTISAVEEDDRSASPTLDDDQDRLVTLQELLFSQRDEAGQNQPSLTSLSLIEGGDQSKGGPSQEEVISTDTLRGSGLVSSMLGTPTQHHGDYEHHSSMENPHFVENRGSGSCTDTRGSPCSRNTCSDAMTVLDRQEPQERPGTGTIRFNQHIVVDPAPTPSSGENCAVVTDKSNTVPCTNVSTLPDNLLAEDIATKVTRPEQANRPMPGCSQDGGVGARTDQKRVVKTMTKENDDDRSVVCVHDEDGTCGIDGPGAKEMSKPVRVTRTFKNGTTRSVMTKKKWWKCDLGMRGGRLRQTQLSFSVVLEASRAGRRDNKRNLGQQDASEGQDLS